MTPFCSLKVVYTAVKDYPEALSCQGHPVGGQPNA